MWQVTCDRWHVTGDMWQMTRDRSHMTCDTYGVVSIDFKFQVPSTYCTGEVSHVKCHTLGVTCHFNKFLCERAYSYLDEGLLSTVPTPSSLITESVTNVFVEQPVYTGSVNIYTCLQPSVMCHVTCVMCHRSFITWQPLYAASPAMKQVKVTNRHMDIAP